MPTNVTMQYQKAEEEYHKARNISEKLKALQKMLREVPKHKGSEALQSEIKQKISKYKKLTEKERLSKKGGRYSISVKKEGAATVMIVGTTNSGKSSLLKKITNANPLIADYEFTTRKPEIGIMHYDGVLIQVVEIPAIVEDYIESDNGATYLGIIRQADLLIITGDNKLVLKELRENNISKDYIFYKGEENIKEMIWNRLGVIRVYTKQPGKKKTKIPIALEKNSSIKDMAEYVHRDFIKRNIKKAGKSKFIINKSWARVWGKSAKHDGMRVGMNHKLADGDIVELHVGK